MSTVNASSNSEERNTYSDTILLEKNIDDSCNIVNHRLSEVKAVNEQFGSLLFEIATVQRTYAAQLRKLIAENENFKQNVASRLLSKKVVTQEELASLKDFDSLGSELPGLYSNIVDALKTDLKNSFKLISTLETVIVPSIQEYNQNDTQWKETKRLQSKLSTSDVSKGNAWESNGPLLFQMFETTDYERLQFLKSILLEYGLLVKNNEVLQSERNVVLLKNLERFNSDNEIKRYSEQVVGFPFHFDKNKSTSKSSGEKASSSDIPQHTPADEPRRELRHASSTTVLKHDLMNDAFTGFKGKTHGSGSELANEKGNSSSGKKTSKLKSKFGSVFGRKKDNNKSKKENVVTTRSTYPSGSPSKQNTGPLSRTSQVDTVRSSVSSSSSRTPEIQGISSQRQQRNPNLRDGFATGNTPSQVEKTILPSDENEQPHFKSTTTGNETNEVMALAKEPNSIEQQQDMEIVEPITVLEPIKEQESVGVAVLPTTETSHQSIEEHHAPPPLPPSRRHQGNRVQSQLFSDMNVSTVDRHQSVLLPNVTGELLTTLDPQVTGGTTLDVLPAFNHLSTNTDNTQAGLKCSVAEVINCNYTGGVLKKVDVIGEVALNYETNSNESNLPLEISLNMKSDVFKPEKLITNKAFMEKIEVSDDNSVFSETYRINPSFILSKTLGAIKYNVTDVERYVPPVSLLPVWKFEDHQASMVLTIKPNKVPLTLNNFSVFVSVKDCETSSALSKPQGSYNKDKNRIAWRFNKEPIVFNDINKDELKLVARFMTSKMGQESKCSIKFDTVNYPQQIFNFEYLETTDADPFGTEEDSWEPLKTMNTLVTGQYVAHA